MRKLKIIIALTLVILSIPFSSAFAYTGGLLNGFQMNRGASVSELFSISTNVTDNNESTAEVIGKVNSAYDTIYASLSGTPTITDYQLKANSANIKIKYYNSSKNLIREISNPVINGTKTSITPVSNVAYVSLENTSSTNEYIVYEFDVFGAVIDTIPPANVSNLTASNITDTGFTLSWIKPSDNDYSKAEIYLNNELFTVLSGSVQTYPFTGLSSETSYSVKIVSLDNTGNKSNGSTITVKTNMTPDTSAPANVTNLTGVQTHNSIRLTWTNPEDQDFAKVRVYEDGVYRKSVTAAEGSNAFFDNLNPETEYTFKVTSVDTTGNESLGTTIAVMTLPLPVVKDLKNVDANAKYDRVKLSWELPESEYFHHVNIYRKVIKEESFLKSLFSLGTIHVSAADTADGYKPMFETNGTYWTDLTVEPDTGYEYKLTTENTDSRESTGITVQVETPQEPKPKIEEASFTPNENGDYVVSWSDPTTGNVKIKVGGKEYKTVPSSLKTYTIPKSDLTYTSIGDPDITIQPVTERGTEGDVVSSPKTNLPFTAKDLVESGNGLLWLIGPFLLLALALLLVPKFRALILAAFSGKGKSIDTKERRSAQGDKELKLEPKGEPVRLSKEPRELKTPRIRADRAEREVKTDREPRQSIRESRVSRRGR
jgi:hypothetical protein